MTEKTFSTTLLAMPANLDKLGEFQPAHLGKKFSPKHLWRFCLIKKNIGKLLGQFVGKWKTARKSPAGSWANGKMLKNFQRARGQAENCPKISSGLVGKRKTARKSSAGSWANGNGYKMCRWTIFVNPLFLKKILQKSYVRAGRFCVNSRLLKSHFANAR